MNMITGYISSTSGTITVGGADILKQPEEVKKKIGYLPETPPLYMDMTVTDYLNFVYALKKITLNRASHIAEVMETVKITDVKERLIKNLSKGYKQRVGLAQALLGNPEILILDEPTVGLDPKQINEIRSVIRTLGRERTIILSSHILPEVSAICERVIIINNGRIAASDTPENLSKNYSGGGGIAVTIDGPREAALAAIGAVAGIASVTEAAGGGDTNGREYFITTENDAEVRRELFFALAERKLPILALNARRLSLEDVFLKLTTVEHSAGSPGTDSSDTPEPQTTSQTETEEGDGE
jgi:ABC-2 type transport system ATP-binding protein